MPASIYNKLLTKYMRNGQPLCASLTESCPKDPCYEQHKCAIVLQSGLGLRWQS